MEPQSHTYKLTWQGITICVVHTPRRWSAIEHLEIRSIAPVGAALPITATGYRSHFVPIGIVDAHGGDVVAQVRAWLDEEAAKPAWLARIEAITQGELFLGYEWLAIESWRSAKSAKTSTQFLHRQKTANFYQKFQSDI